MHYASLCALVLVALTAPLYVDSCCFPEKWEGGHTVYVPVFKAYTRSKVSINTPRKLMASSALITRGRRSFNVKVVVDWAKKKHYLIFKIKGRQVCRVHNIKKSLPPKSNCLPSSFRKLISYRIGAGKNSLNQVAYGLFRKGYANVLSVTDDCVPVRDSVEFAIPKKRSRRSVYASASWYNITPGIKSASVFNVPKECSRREEETVSDHVKAMEIPEDMYESSIASVYKSIKKFETSHHDSSETELPHQFMNTIQHSIHNLVDNVLDQAKELEAKKGKIIENLFGELL